MRVIKYMAMQRDRLRKKHEGETFLLDADGEVMPVFTRSAYEILKEIDSLRGLNVCERNDRESAYCY